MTADEDEPECDPDILKNEEAKEFDPRTLSDGEYDPSEKKYKGIGGPKDVNDADWWRQGKPNPYE